MTHGLPAGWLLQHRDCLFIKSRAGMVRMRIKFYTYPPYRQEVRVVAAPQRCSLRTKGLNTYYVYDGPVPGRGFVSFDRAIEVRPHPTAAPPTKAWGSIGAIPASLARKYRQRSAHWPLESPLLDTLTAQRWFDADDLYRWVREACTTISGTITDPAPQDRRLGVDAVMRTGRGDCDEYTDLFVTLSRRRGIPSRRLTGYVMDAKATPEAHAWAEVFSAVSGWLPVDVALGSVGKHTVRYVVQKVEEFNPALPDFQIQRQSARVQARWELPLPLCTPLYDSERQGTGETDARGADKSFK